MWDTIQHRIGNAVHVAAGGTLIYAAQTIRSYLPIDETSWVRWIGIGLLVWGAVPLGRAAYRRRTGGATAPPAPPHP
jgi:hypothetical protein